MEDVEADAVEFQVGAHRGLVVIDFGRAVKWLALPVPEAHQFLSAMRRGLQEAMRQAEEGAKEEEAKGKDG